MKSFLQTKEWIDFQKAVGRQTWHYDQNGISAYVVQHDLPFKKNYLYIPYGPQINLNEMSGLKNSLNHFTNYLKEIAQKQESIYIKIEPMSDAVSELLYPLGFRKSSKQVQPSRTVVIDLNTSEDELLGRMHHKTRYNINLASKKDLTFKESESIDIFWDLLKKTSEHDNFSTHSHEYYKKLMGYFSAGQKIKTKLFLVDQESKPIAGAIVLEYNNQAYYLHGAMDRDFRATMAPHLMHWEIIKYYKEKNFTLYDLWGIDAQKWPGVTRFKLGFGGRTIEYSGSFDLPIRKFWYLLYKLARKIRK